MRPLVGEVFKSKVSGISYRCFKRSEYGARGVCITPVKGFSWIKAGEKIYISNQNIRLLEQEVDKEYEELLI